MRSAPLRTFVAPALGLLLLTTAACGDSAPSSEESATATTSTDAPPASGPQVIVRDFEFVPEVVRADVGETVTWKFVAGAMAHNVVGGDLRSPLKRRGTYTFSFDKPGTYSYACTIHPQMKGTIEVS